MPKCKFCGAKLPSWAKIKVCDDIMCMQKEVCEQHRIEINWPQKENNREEWKPLQKSVH